MEDMIIWRAVVRQNMFERSGSKMDKSICLIVGNGFIDINDSESQPNECDASKNQEYEKLFFFWQEEMVENLANAKRSRLTLPLRWRCCFKPGHRKCYCT